MDLARRPAARSTRLAGLAALALVTVLGSAQAGTAPDGAAAAVAAASATVARQAPSAASNPAQERQLMGIAAELRCLVCQNQTIADSHADLAVDLRNQIRDMLEQGKSEDEIRRYMTERYGDFVLYRPPFKATTAALWIGPGVLMVLALGALILVLRRRQKMAASAFDPDTPDEEDDRAR